MTASTKRGGQLELSITRAGRDYRKAGRCVLVRQFPPVASDGSGGAFYSGTAPVDFLGTLQGGRGLAVEAKETAGQSLPCSRLRDDQRMLMGFLHGVGADVRLVIGFTGIGEVYTVGWEALASFLAAPWRESWSLAWCRAHGLLLPQEDANDPARRRVLFLDGAEHPERAKALAAVEVEKAKTRRPADHRQSDDDHCQFGNEPPPAPVRRRTTEERRAAVISAVAEGMERQLRKPRRAFHSSRQPYGAKR